MLISLLWNCRSKVSPQCSCCFLVLLGSKLRAVFHTTLPRLNRGGTPYLFAMVRRRGPVEGVDIDRDVLCLFLFFFRVKWGFSIKNWIWNRNNASGGLNNIEWGHFCWQNMGKPMVWFQNKKGAAVTFSARRFRKLWRAHHGWGFHVHDISVTELIIHSFSSSNFHGFYGPMLSRCGIPTTKIGISWNRGTPSHHPFLLGICPYKPSSYWGTSILGNHQMG